MDSISAQDCPYSRNSLRKSVSEGAICVASMVNAKTQGCSLLHYCISLQANKAIILKVCCQQITAKKCYTDDSTQCTTKLFANGLAVHFSNRMYQLGSDSCHIVIRHIDVAEIRKWHHWRWYEMTFFIIFQIISWLPWFVSYRRKDKWKATKQF